MGPVLVTGGTGTLGRVLVCRLLAGGHEVRVLSRRPPPGAGSAAQWATGDLLSGSGLGAAVSGTEVIVHCASAQRGDARSARHLIDAARKAGCPHLCYISIVGIDQIPFGYYRSKLEAEGVIQVAGPGWTILRTTQFHDLIARGCQTLARLPALPVPARTDFQPIDVREVAARLAELAAGPPAGRVADMGGPQVRSFRELARSYLRAAGRHRLLMPVFLPGALFAAFRRGAHLAPEQAAGTITFEQFLGERFAAAGAVQSGPASGRS